VDRGEQPRREEVRAAARCSGGEEFRGFELQPVVVAPQAPSEGAEPLDDPRVEVAGEGREQIEAQPVAQVASRAVGVVGAPAQAALGEPGLDARAPGEKQGVHETFFVAGRSNAAEAGRAGFGEQAHQDGLRLVVRGVGEGDARAPATREPQEEPETLLAGELLHRGCPALRFGENASEPAVKRQVVGQGDARDGGGVAVGLPASQSMVEMRHLNADAESHPRGQQQVQQAGRVRASGNGGDHAGPRREQAVAGGVRHESRQQRRH